MTLLEEYENIATNLNNIAKEIILTKELKSGTTDPAWLNSKEIS